MDRRTERQTKHSMPFGGSIIICWFIGLNVSASESMRCYWLTVTGFGLLSQERIRFNNFFLFVSFLFFWAPARNKARWKCWGVQIVSSIPCILRRRRMGKTRTAHTKLSSSTECDKSQSSIHQRVIAYQPCPRIRWWIKEKWALLSWNFLPVEGDRC